MSAQLMGQSSALSEQRAKRLETGAAEIEKDVGDLSAKVREHEAERAKAQPVAPDLKAPPTTAARAFLQPGDSILGQLGTVMQGIGLLALGITGTKGRGYAFAATAALKGAAEGWQAGDAARVKRELEAWQANHTHLMDQYQLERDAFNDLLTNQKLSMSERFAEIRMRADAMHLKDLADQARQENLAGVMSYLQGVDKSALEHEKVAAEIAKYKSESEHRLFNEEHSRKMEAHAKEQEAVARARLSQSERRIKLAEEFGGNVMKAQQTEIALRQRLTNLGIVRDAVELLDNEGLLPKGVTFWDKAQVAVAWQSKAGRQDIAQAAQIMQRLATPLVVGTEVSLGMQAQTMRLKVVGEAEAGNIIGAPKGFWDTFLPKAESNYREQLTMTQEHLRHLGLLRAPQEDTIIETTP